MLNIRLLMPAERCIIIEQSAETVSYGIQAGVLTVKLKKLRYLNLLVVIVIMMILSPFTARAPYLRMLSNIVFTLVLLSVVYTVKQNKKIFIAGLVLGIPWVLAAWMHLLNPVAVDPAILALTSIVFDGYIIFVLLRHIIRTNEITADIIYGAVSVYILLGIFFTSIYMFFDAITQTPLFAYAGADLAVESIETSKLFYFSFVTLTTLGYGDIRPIADLSRTFAVIEAMTGVFYSAALIGRLIGLYVAQNSKSEAAAEAASKAAAAAAAAAEAVVAENSTEAAAAAETASQAAADAAVAAEAAKCSGDDDCNDNKDSKEPGTDR